MASIFQHYCHLVVPSNCHVYCWLLSKLLILLRPLWHRLFTPLAILDELFHHHWTPQIHFHDFTWPAEPSTQLHNGKGNQQSARYTTCTTFDWLQFSSRTLSVVLCIVVLILTDKKFLSAAIDIQAASTFHIPHLVTVVLLTLPSGLGQNIPTRFPWITMTCFSLFSRTFQDHVYKC